MIKLLLFIDTQLDVIAKRIVKRYAHLQEANRKAKQAVIA